MINSPYRWGEMRIFFFYIPGEYKGDLCNHPAHLKRDADCMQEVPFSLAHVWDFGRLQNTNERL